MDRILRVDEVAHIQLRHEVFAEGAVHLRIVDDKLLVTRLEEGAECEPLLGLHVVGRQLGAVDRANIGQLVVQRHIVQNVRPALEFAADVQLIK